MSPATTRFALTMIVTGFLLLPGCSNSNENKPGAGNGNGAAAPSDNGSTPETVVDTNSGNGMTETEPIDVGIEVLSGDDFQEVIKQHEGKFLLVDMWALWCEPCVEGFPQTAELSKRYADNLDVISINFDEPEDPEKWEDVNRFLSKFDGKIQHYISELGPVPESFEAFGVEMGLPNIRIYDRGGNLVQTFAAGDAERPWDHTDVEAAVKDLVESGGN